MPPIPVEREHERCGSLQEVWVGFGGRYVSVRADAPEVLAQLRQTFREMLVDAPPQRDARFEVRRRKEGYALQRDGAAQAQRLTHGELQSRLRQAIVHCLVAARPDLLWLHAGGVVYRDRAVLLPAGSGSGKSTLVALLCARGWRYLSDDLVPVDMRTGLAHPFPLTPLVRLGPDRALPEQSIPLLRRARIDLEPEAIWKDPVEIGALLFPAFSHGAALRIRPSAPAQAALEALQRCVNFQDHREAAVTYLVGLVARTPCFDLSFSGAPPAAALVAETLEGCLQA